MAQALIAYIDWGMPVEAIVAQPHLINRFGTYDVEAGTSAEDLVGSLKALGYTGWEIGWHYIKWALMIGSTGERVLRSALPYVDAWNICYDRYGKS